MADGNPGFHRQFDNLLELKWSTGQIGSYRVYCFEQEGVLFLCGGDKSSQSKDIENAKAILQGVLSGKIRTQIYE